MNEWPEGWTGGRGDGYGGGPEPEAARRMRHVRRDDGGGSAAGGPGGVGGPRHPAEPPLPPELSPRGPVPSQRRQPYAQGHPGPGYPGQGQQGPDGQDGYNTGQVYGRGTPNGPGGPGGPGGDGGPGARPLARPNWKKRILIGLAVFLVVVIGVGVGTYFWADSKLRREVDLSAVEDRPSGGKGTNYLIVGSDSREGMSAEDKKKLHTGSADGRRTDSVILLHTGGNGNTMISLPRDSWVTIPAFTGPESGKRYGASQNKLNAAFAMGGPELLVRTVEYNTGLRVDHYAEIGFDGFAKIVDSVGGVTIDVPQDMKEKHAGTDLKKGRQTLNGQEALAFVRQRYGLAGGDLDRTKNQQKFLSALADKAATPSTILNPFKLYPTLGAGLDSLIVDKDMSLWKLRSMFWAMKGVSGGKGRQMNMPVANPGYPTAKGSAVLWNMGKVKQLVKELENDEKVTVAGGTG
ncbi:LCP family protein [Streptomyces sp. B1866]|uniref:LCP family protein n=1 Tax=Streptomyces sp. B1866 TaxID=3075431 RepID=UPI00288ECB59|nr:LCP family protein [Streptomyces sp. B1866]MDT3395861.1 LCP family protein [Streptomyces sp. B1866]